MPANAKIEDLTVSRTQILDYLNCGYRWDLSYRRGIQGALVREAMDLGSATHHGVKQAVTQYALGKKWTPKVARLATKYGANSWVESEKQARGKFLTEEMTEQLHALRDEGATIAEEALDHFGLHEWEIAMWKGKPLLEVELIVPLKPWKGFRTIPDLCARPRKEGRRAPFWLIDWKARAQFESDDAEEINLQFATMQYVIERVIPEISIDGSILWQVKSKAPTWPKLNKPAKDGTPVMSRALIATTWEVYKKALIEAGCKPEDYEEEMRPKLETIEWYRSIKQHRTSEECKAVWREIVVPAARRMATDPQVIRRWVHQPFGCKGCWARSFCMAELRGEDTEFLLQTDYMDTRKPRKKLEMGVPTRQFELT